MKKLSASPCTDKVPDATLTAEKSHAQRPPVLNWRALLKKVWNALPASGRELPLRCLCLLLAGRKHEAQRVSGSPVYVVGNFRSGGGISRSASLYAERLQQEKACLRVDTTEEMLQAVASWHNEKSLISLAKLLENDGPCTLIVHLNPPQFLWLLCKLGRRFIRNKHIVAYWAWELEDIPALWKFALRYADAVEVPSTFTKNAVARNTQKPVVVHPHEMLPPDRVKENFCADGKLHCLFIFDMASLYSRKNPEAVIEAFLRAFPLDRGPDKGQDKGQDKRPEEGRLTIKVMQPRANAAGWQRLQELCACHANINLVDAWLDDAAMEQLFLSHDVYISLHRSEGYGLTILEAMLYNLYVVASGWSGNMDFMTGDRTFPVPCTLVPVDKSDRIFGKIRGARWADPDVEETAKILRSLYSSLCGNGPAKIGGEAV